jgi:hypothetical protein
VEMRLLGVVPAVLLGLLGCAVGPVQSVPRISGVKRKLGESRHRKLTYTIRWVTAPCGPSTHGRYAAHCDRVYTMAVWGFGSLESTNQSS